MAPKRMNREDLGTLKQQVQKERELSPGGNAARITVHLGTCGLASGAGEVLEALQGEVKKSKRKDVAVTTSGCPGFCSQEPLVTVECLDLEPILYCKVDADVMRRIFSRHVGKGEVLKEHALVRGLASSSGSPPKDSGKNGSIPHVRQFPFFAAQRSWVLRNRGLINPDSIEEYIWCDGYQGAAKALLEMEPKEIIGEIKASGLRGRGGGGFPTGLKWDFCAASKGDVKYVLCNADEGDPGAFMDRSVMEGDPHAILEGMIIAAKAIGSHQGYIYCRAEYPLAVKTLTNAIWQARERGLLGKDILGSGFDFDLEIYQGAGAFVCGEETALMTSIEGQRGTPRPRPPFPAVSGLWKKPTILNNVETYANIAQILLQGGEEYARLGTESSKGTKVFALTGKVNNIGLVEVPMGTSLRQIVYEIGGGIPEGKRFKAAQLGGPSGGCIPTEYLDTVTDYEEITKAGAIMGSGGLIVMDEETCMVDMARYFMDFCQDESCGKCTPCRVGTRRMLQILERICRGEGRAGDIELLEDLAASIKDAALCGLGQTAPNPVLSTLRYFRHEYEEHIRGYCPSNVCKRISPAPCQRTCPVGMDVPSYIALIAQGRFRESLEVIYQDNPFPAVCGRICPRPCESNCTRGESDQPLAIRALKRFVAEQFQDASELPPVRKGEPRPERIAIVGAGPAGLAAAHDLARNGYPVTVYESGKRAGGALRIVVPDFRLGPEVVDREVNRISAAVDLRTGTTLGKNVTLPELFDQGFRAVLLATGAEKGVELTLEKPVRNQDVTDARKFLVKAKKGKAQLPGKSVCVIGSGHLALDAARTAIRLGSSKATILYPRSPEDYPVPGEEIATAQEEGVEIKHNCEAVELLKNGEKLAGVHCRVTQTDSQDEAGRRRPVPIEEYLNVECDAVIAALGNLPDTGYLEGHSEVVRGILGNIVVDPGTMETGAPGVFAAGEAVTAGATVIEAIASGQRAAAAIHRSLCGEEPGRRFKIPKPRMAVAPPDQEEDLGEYERAVEPVLELKTRKKGFEEVVGSLSEAQAVMEAKRCLRCDLD
jgi:NADH-quinone oxidoreductase subunit F